MVDPVSSAIEIKNGNVKVYTQVYEQYHQPILFNIYKIIGDIEAARDIMQDVFACLWEDRARLKDVCKIGGWLFTVSYYKSLAFLRLPVQYKIEGIPDMVTDPDEEIERELQHIRKFELVKEALELLPFRNKKAFTLNKLQGITCETTAREMEVSIDSVRRYIRVASLLIRRYIKENHSRQLSYACAEK